MAEASHNKRRKRAKTEEEVVAGDDFEVETIVESSSAEVETISEVDEAVETLPPNDLPPKQPIRVSSAHLPRQVEQTTGSIPQASISDLKKKIDNMKEELNTERSKLTSSFGDLHSMTFSQLVILHIELKNKIQALEAEVEAKVKAKAQLKRR